jgi:hypothetical protein
MFLELIPATFCDQSINQSINNDNNNNNNNNNNPTPEHHHKGNNQPTGIEGGETTVTKKHKGLKTDQGTTRSPS